MKKKNQQHIADVINFHGLFDVKRKNGLWMLRSAFDKQGFCGIYRFTHAEETAIVHKNEMTSLGWFVFVTEVGKKDLSFKDLFKNIFDWETESGIEISETPIDQAMEIAVPCFDDNYFKPHHFHKCVGWYQSILKTLIDGKRNQTGDQIKNNTD